MFGECIQFGARPRGHFSNPFRNKHTMLSGFLTRNSPSLYPINSSEEISPHRHLNKAGIKAPALTSDPGDFNQTSFTDVFYLVDTCFEISYLLEQVC